MTNRFLEAQNLPNLGKGPKSEHMKYYSGGKLDVPTKPQPKCMLCHRFGHMAPDCRTPPKEMLRYKLCG
ncbi:hypothetical protein HPB50_006722 [Hyalomma asiaticum]|uniref:Uncharacterized protein n=1 Tax=Hyalomma asiaticum TaxID=266040 RepID=A0ACB7SZL4_HYAAI|nr:hypothetical protein HPB50_006722 [Hyalomma asiaticum]